MGERGPPCRAWAAESGPDAAWLSHCPAGPEFPSSWRSAFPAATVSSPWTELWRRAQEGLALTLSGGCQPGSWDRTY